MDTTAWMHLLFVIGANTATIILGGMLLIALLNAFTFPRLTRFAQDTPGAAPSPPVSVLIPTA